MKIKIISLNSGFLQYRILNVQCKIKNCYICKETEKWGPQSRGKQTIKTVPQIIQILIGFSTEFKTPAFNQTQRLQQKYGLNELTYREFHKRNRNHKKKNENSINEKSNN